ncbi:hypothetical protein ES708_00501 [subsurface metagenome]
MNGMTLIVKTVTRLILGFIVVFGASIVIYGHITPGGGFAGGVMLSCAMILLVLSMGKTVVFDVFSEKKLSAWDTLAVLGIIEIMFIGLYGFFSLHSFFTEGTPLRLLSGGTIMWSNLNIGIKVSAFLFAVFMALAVFRIERKS